MTKEEIITIIYEILDKKIELPTLSYFHENARLNEDLYMDSVIILELILHLELDYGFTIPDEQMDPNDFKTVERLALFLEKRQKEATLEGER
ncbi:petrobactin biosynthesis protein AsbD [Bacillus suaedae]|uniref:Petrobactin biosynthesis protein AsbD n=1 Tax=Halalkalibacter suaedae TaxID=2822140 RepID=A0A941ATT3_9BACI|nr:petrobactin biosynthesis protein AsbD [Bacillus suaedae]MBP3952664.1 petrobactin biosynthesis protein AsbD [Bacillus suaedae]